MDKQEINKDIDDYLENIEKVYKNYGLAHQLLKMMEEVSELQSAILDFIDFEPNHMVISHGKKTNVRDHLVEEMADVEIMIDQISLALGCVRERLGVKFDKARRTIKRIEEENETKNRTGNTEKDNGLYI